MQQPAEKLRTLLDEPGLLLMPGCHDAQSARLVEQAGFRLGFMSGFAVSAARLGMPDTGLISYGELVDQGRNICRSVSIPMIGDGDTGFGNAQNIKRTVQGYAAAGFACIMLEDQVAPKRCGHTEGKTVVARDEALTRVRAAIDARNEGADILIMARTDARACIGLDEAVERCQAFRDLGADITFLEAPESQEEMRHYCASVAGPKMANLIEGGKTPVLSVADLTEIGYKIAVYPLTLLNVSIQAMRGALADLARGQRPSCDGVRSVEGCRGIPRVLRRRISLQDVGSPGRTRLTPSDEPVLMDAPAGLGLLEEPRKGPYRHREDRVARIRYAMANGVLIGPGELLEVQSDLVTGERAPRRAHRGQFRAVERRDHAHRVQDSLPRPGGRRGLLPAWRSWRHPV